MIEKNIKITLVDIDPEDGEIEIEYNSNKNSTIKIRSVSHSVDATVKTSLEINVNEFLYSMRSLLKEIG